MLAALCIAMTFLPVGTAPVGEGDSLLNDMTSSSGDIVDTSPTMTVGKAALDESEYQIVNNEKTTPVVYRTMTPEIIARQYTTLSTTLPPLPPTTEYATLIPRTTMRKEDIQTVTLETTLNPLVKTDEETSSTKTPQTPPSTVSFTTAPIAEKVEEVRVEASSTTTTSAPEATTQSKSSTTTEDGPILVVIGDSQSTQSSPSSTVKATTKLSTLPSTTEEEDGAILVEADSEVTEKAVLTSTTTIPSSTASTESDGILVDVVAVETGSKSSTTLQPSTTKTTLPTTVAETTVSTVKTEAPIVVVKVEASTTTSTVEDKVEVIESKTTEGDSSTTTKSTTVVEKTTEDGVIIVVPGDKIEVGDENKLKKNESSKILHSTKTDYARPSSTEATSPVVLKSESDKDIKYGVLSDLKTDPPPTPDVDEEDYNVNATLIGESKEGGLSYAARTGIAMACIVGFWIIIGPLVCLICKLRDKKRDKKEKEERNAREKANSSLVEEMVKAELQKTPNGEKKKMYNDDKHDDGEIEPITIGDSDSMPYIDADANSRDTAL